MIKWTLPIAILLLVAGCTSHPAGEKEERARAMQMEAIDRPVLPENPTVEDLVNYALLSNAELDRQYWDWRSAIEQIPQDGTQPTNVAIAGGVPIMEGSTSFKKSSVTLSNDPMADILWPSKPTLAAKQALEMAKAAGVRFVKTRYEIRAKVLAAYFDYASTAELIRLEQRNGQLLQTMVTSTEARNRAGSASQIDVLKSSNELDMSRNDLASMQAQLPAQLAALNALLNRAPDAAVPLPAELPAVHRIEKSDADLLALAAKQNPELIALAHEVETRNQGIEIAKLQYLPDFSASISTDMAGMAQNLMGMITVPFLKYEAINAAVAQARANLRAAQAMRRQEVHNLNAEILMDITTVRDADRQLELFDQTILPRLQRMVEVSRTAYENGQSSLLDFLDSQRSLIAIQRLVVNLRTGREKSLANLEAATASVLTTPVNP
ncbi:MAG TPA: TolC family protein [Tepidisphaeraceae bacterium]|nr:TolC family protein [Tepidisphaeraceae bacterium]